MKVFVAIYVAQGDAGILGVHSTLGNAQAMCEADARESQVLPKDCLLTWRQNGQLDEWFAHCDDDYSYEIGAHEFDPVSTIIREEP